MESGINHISYLHKKFKKQLSVELNAVLRSSPTKTTETERYPDRAASDAPDVIRATENKNERVPNTSTNDCETPTNNCAQTVSSISLDNRIGNFNDVSISYPNSHFFYNNRPPSFDTKFNEHQASSNLDVNHQSFKAEDISSNETDQPEELTPKINQLSDKNTSGKYVCAYCNLACTKPSVLQKHIRAHTNERPYPCVSCGFSFKTRSNLYKHCRSRTHANRVLGNKVQEVNESEMSDKCDPARKETNQPVIDYKSKLYKPRFHMVAKTESLDQTLKENIDKESSKNLQKSDILSHHINELINKNHSIIHGNNTYLQKKKSEDLNENNNESIQRSRSEISEHMGDLKLADEPLNLTYKGRKRCISEAAEPLQKSLIKELLLKNLSSDMQCPHCKMIFQTVTELELHKLRSCKGFVKPGEKMTRSNSVNVASILSQNKNTYDNQVQSSTFPLKSPGPFLGKTRLVEADKMKSFSFEDGLSAFSYKAKEMLSPKFNLSIESSFEKKAPIKLFGGELKITQSSGDTKSFKIDRTFENISPDYVGKVCENRVVKSSLHSGGTVLTNKVAYNNLYEGSTPSPSIEMLGSRFNFDSLSEGERKKPSDLVICTSINHTISSPSCGKYTNIADFSQNAVKLLTPNLKHPNISIPGLSFPNKFNFANSDHRDLSRPLKIEIDSDRNSPQNLMKYKSNEEYKTKINETLPSSNLYNPVNILIDGKIVRYVPGIPGPVIAENPNEQSKMLLPPTPTKISPKNFDHQRLQSYNQIPIENDIHEKPRISLKPPTEKLEIRIDSPVKLYDQKSPKTYEARSPVIKRCDVKTPPKIASEVKKFARPNSLALKPTTAALKQHHGLTPTMFNQILISPDTPRVAKKYIQQYLNGNYFSYLGLKSTTRPVYCTLNKTQPFYVPHFKKLSMYSEWRQQDTKTDKLYVSLYDSRQKNSKYTIAGQRSADLIVHSSYKYSVPDKNKDSSEDNQKAISILGGYECNEDYTYIRGRGRGRYVCEQCGIRCKKPSMLKKHIRTHSNDRPYTCSHCNFSFKTKGNLTKHMKSKVHTKNYTANSSSSSTQQSGTQSSDTETDDSGMDSSDESTRQQEHEAAYGLLSLSQKSTHPPTLLMQHQIATISPTSQDSSPLKSDTGSNIMDTEEIAYVSKTNYAKNKILEQPSVIKMSAIKELSFSTNDEKNNNWLSENNKVLMFLGKSNVNRPLTYPYTSDVHNEEHMSISSESNDTTRRSESISSFSPESESKIKQFQVIQKYTQPVNNKIADKEVIDKISREIPTVVNNIQTSSDYTDRNINSPLPLVVNQTEKLIDFRKRKNPTEPTTDYNLKLHKNDEVMDLSQKKPEAPKNGVINHTNPMADFYYQTVVEKMRNLPEKIDVQDYVPRLNGIKDDRTCSEATSSVDKPDKNFNKFDNSAMETLADIATQQVKIEKNAMAKSVASEFLKLATKQEYPQDDLRVYNPQTAEVNDLIVKPEGNKSCAICAKSFSKPSQLRLHMNVHYLERPFRCESCSVSFRTKGHLQKHERSASHNNKLSSSPALLSSEPRPFKCSDCNIAFRIHGHLAKHLRSKMHIMKLECLAKIPFGLYAELERANSLLTEINTADGDQCLESLKTLAKKVFLDDPGKKHMVGNLDGMDTN